MKIDGTEDWCGYCRKYIEPYSGLFCSQECAIKYMNDNYPNLIITNKELIEIEDETNK
ncbi:MAG: hypothetical protein WC934_06910 [Acidithiobacillus sp.]|jgi:hypothetical protein|uniref:hypothetical protein n=1 Tax=Acidithiobacillus sp. TaxID=1872118 RepID=UPI0035609B92